MAPHQANQNIQKDGQQRPVPKHQTWPQAIKKDCPQPSPRQSKRPQPQTVPEVTNAEPKQQPPSPTSNAASERKRKRSRGPEDSPPLAPFEPLRKQRRTALADPPAGETWVQRATTGINDKKSSSIAHWSKEGRWPKEYFNQDNKTRKDLERFIRIPWMSLHHLPARRKSMASLRSGQMEGGSTAPSSATPSDQKPREIKSIPYTRTSYEVVLAKKHSFMDDFDLGITDASKKLCRNMLEAEQSVPQDSLFRDDLFKETCQSLLLRNEAMIVRDISPLICPSAQVLRIYGSKHLKALNESVNEGWNCVEPFYGPRPQPDYSVGFGLSAFTDDQLEKLNPFVGEIPDTSMSLFLSTSQMFLPFLTCEVKYGAAALDVADRQNAHSMTLAVRGVVELFRVVKREKELDREILAFSISHDHRRVRIYGHYPVIDGEKTAFYRHTIHTFDFTVLDGKEKWTAYKFTKNIYDIWMPTHLKRLCSVIDALPTDLGTFQQSEAGHSGISQGLESLSNQISHDAASLDGSESPINLADSGDGTPETPLSQTMDGKVIQKVKKRVRPEELDQSQDAA